VQLTTLISCSTQVIRIAGPGDVVQQHRHARTQFAQQGNELARGVLHFAFDITSLP
jgi:hypothetical protein